MVNMVNIVEVNIYMVNMVNILTSYPLSCC